MYLPVEEYNCGARGGAFAAIPLSGLTSAVDSIMIPWYDNDISNIAEKIFCFIYPYARSYCSFSEIIFMQHIGLEDALYTKGNPDEKKIRK